MLAFVDLEERVPPHHPLDGEIVIADESGQADFGALAEPGEHSTMPPRRTGGNIDIKQIVAGASLYLPVEVEGALFSVGDAHAAQGDGEVCVSAIEMSSTTTLRLTVRTDLSLAEPQFSTPGIRARGSGGAAYVQAGRHESPCGCTRVSSHRAGRRVGRGYLSR
jgi:acetamidase/formamidase